MISDPDTLIVDIRPQNMIDETGMFDCAVNVDKSQYDTDAEFAAAVSTLVGDDLDHPIVVYCASQTSSDRVSINFNFFLLDAKNLVWRKKIQDDDLQIDN